MRKIIFAAAVSAALLVAGPISAASAVEGYSPDEPTNPSLSGTVADGECMSDAPWINYSVELTDPAGLHTSDAATLVISSGANVVSVPLGSLVDGELSGSVLWPGASVDANGVANGWPGWEQVDGDWVQTNGNFGWTRGAISAKIVVNPEIVVPLSYPAASGDCATAPRGQNSVPASLPLTGMDAAVLPLSIAGGAAALIGVGLLVAQRRRRSQA
ncbi:LPXTG cell wall anchor domain-containing protein [Planococcus sp. APC 4015]|nr:LPXTG cell wall anchor domain-containing protein [Planococcus sp. APC 4015]